MLKLCFKILINKNVNSDKEKVVKEYFLER